MFVPGLPQVRSTPAELQPQSVQCWVWQRTAVPGDYGYRFSPGWDAHESPQAVPAGDQGTGAAELAAESACIDLKHGSWVLSMAVEKAVSI